jgi:hypothetical protein
MEDMIIASKGFSVDDFFIENFTLTRGDYLSVDFYSSHDFKVEKKLYKILSGAIKSTNISISENIIPVITPMMKSGPVFLSRKTAFKYLTENSLLTKEEVMLFLNRLNINPQINIFRLGATERKLLSLEAAYSKSKNIIISTSGIDYSGIDKLRERIGKELTQGILIEINYPNSRGREYLFDGLGIRQKKITVKSPN